MKRALADAQQARQSFLDTWESVRHLLEPERTLRGMLDAVQNAKTPEEVVTLQQSAVGVIDEMGRAGKARACAFIREAFQPFAQEVETLLNAAHVALHEIRQDAQQAEAALFDSFGMTWEPTQITARVRAVEAQLAEMRGTLKTERERPPSQVPSRGALAFALEFFSQA